MNRNIRNQVLLVCSFALIACQPSDQAPANDKVTTSTVPVIYTVNYPLAWMAQRIGGKHVDVVFPAPDDVDPAHWQPSAETILKYQDADLVLLNGAGYAVWTSFASLSSGRIVNTSRGLEDRFVPAGEVTHSHGPKGEHDHGDHATHTWLDPMMASEQARVIASVLSRKVTDHEAEIQENLATVLADLEQLDSDLQGALGNLADSGVLYSHPVFQYLDARYKLDGDSLAWEPDEDPGQEEWQKLLHRVAEQPIAIMLWESEPMRETAERLVGMGIEPIVFAIGNVAPGSGDYLSVMNENIDRLTQTLSSTADDAS